jgi:hypothetical protein
MGRHMPLAEVSVVNTAPGDRIARDGGNGRRREQGGRHNSQRSGRHLKPSLPDERAAYWLAHIGDFGPP